MKNEMEELILETIQKNASVMSLFKLGYPYSQMMRWCQELEEEGKIDWDEGARKLTKKGRVRLTELRKSNPKSANFVIHPFSQYKIEQINIEDIYLP